MNLHLIPEKRSRVITLSRLQYGVPIAEIKAETKRPDKFMLKIERGEVDFSKFAQKEEEDPGASEVNDFNRGSKKKSSKK